MPKTDFFDDDLVKRHDTAPRIKMGPGDSSAGTFGDPNSGTGGQGVSDLNLGGMSRRREELGSQVAQAAEELELLRSRQEDLEREKHDLEGLRRREHEYEAGRKEVLTHLTQSLVTLEKDEIQAEKLGEILAATRRSFRGLLDEVEALDEDTWPDDRLREELDKALAVIERVRVEYNKSISRIEAASPQVRSSTVEHAPVVLQQGALESEAHTFGHWFKVGVAVTLPLVITLLIIGSVLALLQAGIL